MPMYVLPVTISPLTYSRSPRQLITSLIRGYIYRVEVEFPNGCLNAVGIRILDGGRQIAPLPSGWLTGNDRIIEWLEYTRLEGPPWTLIIEGYNEAIDWPHTPVVRLEVR